MISIAITAAAERSRTLTIPGYPNALSLAGADATWPVNRPIANGMRHPSALAAVNAVVLTDVVPDTQAGRGIFAGTKQARPPRGVPR
jgi:hypothetical protein